jgi:endoglucanase
MTHRASSLPRRLLCAAAVLALLTALALAANPAKGAVNLFARQCTDPYPAQRDPANPLMLGSAPGANPLNGAAFFVNGPAHGAAAGAIARLLGVDAAAPLGSVLPGFPETEGLTTFIDSVLVRLRELLDPSLTNQIALLAKIADEPEVQRVSSFSQGGGPGAIYSQTEKLFCHNFLADPGAVPIISTYFLHPDLGGCATPAQIAAYMPTFQRRVNELVAAVGNRPVVLLLETDAFGSSSCMARQGDLADWEAAVRYEVDATSALPHAVVYVEGGYSDANSPGYTARALDHVDIWKIRGFFTNDTHLNWTIDEIRWGERVSRLTRGHPHFIVNTAQNGNGPLVPRNRVKNGNEVLCNPPGRALGPRPTTSTGVPFVDAFLWTSVPGNSSGTCNGGTASGTFWAARAEMLAANANARLGPSGPSQPY